MNTEREIQVHFLPAQVKNGSLQGCIAVAIDVLRASTTIVHALAAGCLAVRPCLEIDEARALADSLPAGKVLLGGERGGKPVDGFDLGNSPSEYTAQRCRGTTIVLTTSHGTRAILRAAEAERVLVGAFVNYSAVCEVLGQTTNAIHLVCAGTDGEPALEDILLAGAFVDFLSEAGEVHLNDSARVAWDCFEHHGQALDGSLQLGKGGTRLLELGYEADIRSAALVDRFNLVPELRRDPLRIEIGAVGFVKSRWGVK
jgi:2-phosphosulfolactate phosphatase